MEIILFSFLVLGFKLYYIIQAIINPLQYKNIKSFLCLTSPHEDEWESKSEVPLILNFDIK
jgi:hypothetical protein